MSTKRLNELRKLSRKGHWFDLESLEVDQHIVADLIANRVIIDASPSGYQ